MNLQVMCDNLKQDCLSYLNQGILITKETFKHSHSQLLTKAPTLYEMIIDSTKNNNLEQLDKFLPVMISILTQIENGQLSRDNADKLIGEFFAKEFIPQYKK